MLNWKLTIAYDGSEYFGWQKSPSKPTIEGTLEGVLATILQENISLQAASRTDKGVHAKSQCVNFFTKSSFDVGKVLCSANRLLPGTIRALSLEEAKSTFHPSLDAVTKTYLYQVYVGKVLYPHERFFYWHCPKAITQEVEEAFPLLIGEKTFAAFSTDTYDSPICTLKEITVKKEGDYWFFRLQGNRFLYKMVRAIVGTLMGFAQGAFSLADIERLFVEPKRAHAGVSAPGRGLFLETIDYKEEQSV
ncbi:MAG: tRNA pseudouridine(38-40) synthase TruA [Chlamydiota bacterium]